MHVERYYKHANFAPARWYGVTANGDGVRIAYRAHTLRVTRGDIPLRGHPESTVVLDIEHQTDGNMSRLDHDELRTILKEHGITLNTSGRLTSPDDEIQAVLDRTTEYVNNKEIDD